MNLSFKHKDVYGGAAAVIGMTMTHLNDHETVSLTFVYDHTCLYNTLFTCSNGRQLRVLFTRK